MPLEVENGSEICSVLCDLIIIYKLLHKANSLELGLVYT